MRNTQDLLQRLGLLSKTLAHSPTIQNILPARLRSKHKDDLVFVGQDYIQLYEIDAEGNLTYLATKDDFDSRIMAAAVIGYFDPYDYEDGSSQSEVTSCDEDVMGPQMLVLTLESRDLVFLAASESPDGVVKPNRIIRVPMPRAKTPSRQLGKYCAVDPYSRAIAVAAGEDEILLYSAKPAEQLSHGQSWDEGFLPISCSRQVLGKKGHIVLMDFLYPPDDEPDRIILLLIVIRDKKTYLYTVNWLYSEDDINAKEKIGQRIPTKGHVPNLLIPLRSNAAFILTVGENVLIYENLLTGHAREEVLLHERNDEPPDHPVSSNRPLWAAWTRPRRGDRGLPEDYIYISTEDGETYYWVFQTVRPSEGSAPIPITNLGCHIDSAIAPFGKSRTGDVLVVAGESSEGGVWMSETLPDSVVTPEVGPWQSTLVNKLPNWSRNFDLVSTGGASGNLPPHSRSLLFAPSGRQPCGRISELRMGVEARLGHRISDDFFITVTHMWMLHVEEEQDYLLLLSGPGYTRAMSIPQTLNQTYSGEIHETIPLGLDTDHSTLAAATIQGGGIMQISESGIFISSGERSLFFQRWPPGSKVAATITADRAHTFAVISLYASGESSIQCFRANMSGGQVALTGSGNPAVVDFEVLSLAMFDTGHGSFVVAGTSSGAIKFFTLQPQGLVPAFEHSISKHPQASEALDGCESIMVLSGDLSPSGHGNFMLLCGLRSGSIYALEMRASREEALQLGSYKHFVLGLTTVKLTPGISERAPFAACDRGLFNIVWTGDGLQSVKIFDVWVTDTDDSSFCQDAISAFAVVPRSDSSVLSDALTLVSGGEFLITGVDQRPIVDQRPSVVPRSIQVQGSPRILLESSSLGCLVSVATKTRLRPPRTRIIQEVIEFTSTKSDWKYVYEMEPGLKVYSIMEWSYFHKSDKYVFLVVATGSMDPSSRNSELPSSKRGSLMLLKPSRHDGRMSFKKCHVQKFSTDVTAIAPYGEMAYIACSGQWICMLELEFSTQGLKFLEVGKVKIECPAVNVTTAPPQIYVTTARNSTITFQVSGQNTPTIAGQPEIRTLTMVGSDTKQRAGLHHVTLDLQDEEAPDSGSTTKLNIMSTKTGDVVGLSVPRADGRQHLKTMPPLFTAKLNRSLMRIRQARMRPPWKPAKVQGVLNDELVGISVDGTITGLAVLDERLTHRLRWVQRLCERDDKICPFTLEPNTNPASLILPPLGFNNGQGLGSSRYRPEDMAVNADIVQRLLDHGGASKLRQMMKHEADKGHDRIGIWVRENLDAQLSEVGALISEIESVVDRWV